MDLTNILNLASNSDTGRKRHHNEDSSAIDATLGLLIMADGMGGYRAGEVASAIATSSIHQHVGRRIHKNKIQITPKDSQFTYASLLLRDAIREANYEVYRASQSHRDYAGMGTTVVALMFYDNRYTVAHVGDSRLYRLRGQQLDRITNDHSLLQEMIDRGLYTAEEAEQKTPKNLVTRALGVNEIVSVDLLEGDVETGDLFLLCTDGLSDMIQDDEIKFVLQKFGDNLNRAAQELVDLANEQGGKDNISVILAKPNNAFSMKAKWLGKLFNTK